MRAIDDPEWEEIESRNLGRLKSLIDFCERREFEMSSEDAEFTAYLIASTNVMPNWGLYCLIRIIFAAGYKKGYEISQLERLLEKSYPGGEKRDGHYSDG